MHAVPSHSVPALRALAAALLACATACATTRSTAGASYDDPISTDRPSYTNGPDVVHAPQAEAGVTAARDGATHDYTLGELLVRVPVTRRLEARAGVNSYHVTRGDQRASGYEDPDVEVKALLGGRSAHAPAIVPTLGIIAGSTLPLGSREIGERTLQPHAALAASWDLGPRAELQSNLGYTYGSAAGRRFGQLASSATVSASITPRVTPYAEYYALLPGARGSGPGHFADVGLTVLLSPDFQVDARVGAGGTGQEDRQRTVGLGLARRW